MTFSMTTSSNQTNSNVIQEPLKTIKRYKRTDTEWIFAVLRGADLNIKDEREYLKLKTDTSPLSIRNGSAANPCVRQRLRSLFMDAFDDAFFDRLEHQELGFLTIVDQRWWTSDRDFEFNLEAANRQINNFLQNRSYLGIWEFANILNWRAPIGKGRLISPHAHILVWGKSCRAMRTALKRRNQDGARFKASFDGTESVRLDRVSSLGDLHRVVGYMTKSPLMGYRIRPFGINRFKVHKTQNTHAGQLRLYRILDIFALTELMFGGGEGAEIAQDIRAELRKRGIALTRS